MMQIQFLFLFQTPDGAEAMEPVERPGKPRPGAGGGEQEYDLPAASGTQELRLLEHGVRSRYHRRRGGQMIEDTQDGGVRVPLASMASSWEAGIRLEDFMRWRARRICGRHGKSDA